MAGTTIDGLNAVTSLTAQDEVPVWDKEASGEPTKKITAQNMASSVKTLGNLVNTTEMNNALSGKQNTLTFDTTPTTGSTNPVTSGGIATAISQSTAEVVKPAGTMTGNVIDALKAIPNGSIAFWGNSNAPTNAPAGMDYGSYTVFKSAYGACTIIVVQLSKNKVAFANAVDPTTATTINWIIK